MKLGPTLEERVRHLEDRVAIGELIARSRCDLHECKIELPLMDRFVRSHIDVT